MKVAIALAIVASAALAQNQPAPATPSVIARGSISGVVRDASTGKPCRMWR